MHLKINNLWLVVVALFLALGWLLPNNSLPWLAFHREAFVAVVILGLACWLMWPNTARQAYHAAPLVFLALCLVPWLQLEMGVVVSLGIAWMHSLYLFGFALALLLGEKWERDAPGQAVDLLFLALTVGALASAMVAIYQWMGIRSAANEWILNSQSPTRQFANLAQPNLLGSLLLMGTLGLGWGYWRGRLHGAVAIGLAMLLMMAAALTGSRTASLNVFILLVLAAVGRQHVPHRRWGWALAGIALFHGLCVLLVPLLADVGGSAQARTLNDVRLHTWRVFLDISLQKPWFGFGAGQVMGAYFSAADRFQSVSGIWGSAHNLVIDALLWYGLPIGLLLTGFIAYWMHGLMFRHLRSFGHMLVLAVAVVLGIHALLEFPLQYGYFLFPLGVLLGTLHASMRVAPVLQAKPWGFVVLCLMAVAATAVTLRDYFRAQDSFYGLRFEMKGLPSSYAKTPPEVLMLTHLRDTIIMARNEPRRDVSEKELQWMRNTILTITSAWTQQKLAANLALNGQADEARLWNERNCRTLEPAECLGLGAHWQVLGQKHPAIAAIPWPMPKVEP